MEIEDFAEKVCSAVTGELGSGYKMEVRKVKKNNGILMYGLQILDKGQNVVPTIYLESFWEGYKSGVPFQDITYRLLSIYHGNRPKKGIKYGGMGRRYAGTAPAGAG
ncbi:MAG: DUF5688 family protein [Lachnospiraceae bacterium]|nr:DUF5688 family protein [Lachnospiraceae bacterium]